MISVTLDAGQKTIKAMLDAVSHINNGAPRACVQAVNDTLKDVRNEAVRLAKETYTARASDLRRKSKITRANPGTMTGKFSIKDKRGLNLVNFQARPNAPFTGPVASRPKDGASVKVLRQGSRKNPRKHGQKAFIARGASGNTLMFVRTGKRRADLVALYGPHPIQALGRTDNRNALEKKSERLVTVNLQRAIDNLIFKTARGKK